MMDSEERESLLGGRGNGLVKIEEEEEEGEEREREEREVTVSDYFKCFSLMRSYKALVTA
jgi:hypothetical protein